MVSSCRAVAQVRRYRRHHIHDHLLGVYREVRILLSSVLRNSGRGRAGIGYSQRLFKANAEESNRVKGAQKLNSHVRLWMTLSIVIFSAIYGVLLAHDIGKAVAWGIGYICVVLTIMLLLQFRKSNGNK